MGLLGKLLGTVGAAIDGSWQQDGSGVVDGGDIGGDIQAGNSYSIRYVRQDLPGSLITVTFYPVQYDGSEPGEWSIQRQTEWLVCEDPADPGGTEIWSDGDYQDVACVDADSVEVAEWEARDLATAALGDGWTHDWSGLPEWGRVLMEDCDRRGCRRRRVCSWCWCCLDCCDCADDDGGEH